MSHSVLQTQIISRIHNTTECKCYKYFANINMYIPSREWLYRHNKCISSNLCICNNSTAPHQPKKPHSHSLYLIGHFLLYLEHARYNKTKTKAPKNATGNICIVCLQNAAASICMQHLVVFV